MIRKPGSDRAGVSCRLIGQVQALGGRLKRDWNATRHALSRLLWLRSLEIRLLPVSVLLLKREASRAMPAKRDAFTELAEKMLRALEAQRNLGTNAYPTTLRRLVELTDPTADIQTLQKAVKKKVFASRTVVVQPKNLDCPVAFVEDADQLAASAALLEYLLESLCTAASPTIEVAKLKKKASASLREVFGTAVDRRLADNALPSGVAVLTVKSKPHLHLQRFPLPRKPEEVLAEELVKVLQAQRQLGAGAYPTALARLIELTRPAADPALVKKAMTQPTFKTAVVLAIKKEPEAPVALTGDLQLLADSPQLLVMALRKVRTDTDQVHPPEKLKAKVEPPLRKAFEESISRRAADGRLPPGVSRLLQQKKPRLFFLSDVVSSTTERSEQARPGASDVNYPTADNGEVNPRSGRADLPQASASTAQPSGEFVDAFDEAFRRLDKQGRSHNFVSLLELRRSLPLDRRTFDSGLRELRRAGSYTLSAAEGRHGVSPEEQDAGIIEDGALLLYVSRKLS